MHETSHPVRRYPRTGTNSAARFRTAADQFLYFVDVAAALLVALIVNLIVKSLHTRLYRSGPWVLGWLDRGSKKAS